MAKLYVGNLPYTYNESSIRDMFSGFQEIQSVSLITDKQTGRSKGFGFVELSDADADKAIAELNGKDIGGRTVVVSIARPMEDRPRRDFGGGGNSRGGGFGGGKRSGGFNRRG